MAGFSPQPLPPNSPVGGKQPGVKNPVVQKLPAKSLVGGRNAPDPAAAAMAALAARSAAMNARYTPKGGKGPVAPDPPARRGGVPAGWTGRGGPGLGFTPSPGGGGIPGFNVPNVNPSGNVPSVPGNYGDLFNNILQSAQQLYNTPNPAAGAILRPGQVMAGLGSNVVNPAQIGKDAGLGYDALINQLTANQGTTERQNAQDLADIANWYGQAAKTQQQGSVADAAALAQQLAGQQGAAQAFISALGGDANSGAAGIANASDIASAALRGIGTAESDFNNNMNSVVALDKAQQLRNERTAGDNRITDILNQIAQAKGDQASAVAQARDNAQQTKFGELQGLAQLKANLQGNRYNELQGLRQQKLSELGGLSNTILGTALAGPQIQGAEIANQGAAAGVAGQTLKNVGYQAQLKQMIRGTGAANDISAAPLNVRQGIVSQFAAKGGPFVNAVGDLKMAPPAIKSALRNQLVQTYGIQPGPSLETFVNGLTQAIVTPLRVSNYDKAHKTSYYRQGGYK